LHLGLGEIAAGARLLYGKALSMNAMVAFLLLNSSVCAKDQHSEEPTTNASALLQHCSRAFSAMDHVSLHEVEESIIEPDFHDSYQRKTESWIRRDGDRLEIDGEIRYFDEKRKKRSSRFQTVVNKGERIAWNWPLEAKWPPKSGSFTKEKGAEDIAGTCGELDGYFFTILHGEPVERLPNLLLQKGTNLQLHGEERIAGVPCRVVTGELPRLGRFTLWLTEGKGYLPLKITHEMSPADLRRCAKITSSFGGVIPADGSHSSIHHEIGAF
jgi:hypothetical protein